MKLNHSLAIFFIFSTALPLVKTSFLSFLDKYLNEQEKRLSLCYNRPDGTYSLRDSFKYLNCKDGKAEIRECNEGQIFVPTCGKCLLQIYAQRDSFCNGRVATSQIGKIIQYQNPWDCKSWFECTYGIPIEYVCPNNTQFSPENQQCVFNAKECKLADRIASHSSRIFIGKPNHVDAALLWQDRTILLIDSSTFYKFDSKNAELMPGFPVTLNYRKQTEIPANVDASLNMPGGQVHFFKGENVWLWGSSFNPRYIRKEWIGLPADIDAAFYWPSNKKVYFFKREYFYRFDPTSRSPDFGYPKLITQGWPGATSPIDAAVGLGNGTVFLFKSKNVLTFNPPLCNDNESFISTDKEAMLLQAIERQ